MKMFYLESLPVDLNCLDKMFERILNFQKLVSSLPVFSVFRNEFFSPQIFVLLISPTNQVMHSRISSLDITNSDSL